MATLLGWFTDADFNNSYTITTMPAKDLTLYAKWKADILKVSFYDQNGELIITREVMYGHDLDSNLIPAIPEVEGKSGSFDINDFTNITKDLEVHLNYVNLEYIVRFIDHDGAILHEEFVLWNSNATAPSDPERIGYTFLNWEGNYTNVTSNLEIKAIYAPIMYNVSLMLVLVFQLLFKCNTEKSFQVIKFQQIQL